MYKTINIEIPFIITRVENHDKIKDLILEDISKLGIHSNIEHPEISLSNTDWNLKDQVYKREYLNYIKPIIEQVYNNIIEVHGVSNKINLCEHVVCWFNQYEKDDYIFPHIHPKSTYSSVYYLDGCNNKTTFIVNNKEFQIDVNEGEVLTFFSGVSHESKPNKSGKIKTIILWNM